jgi:hypothetical protein
MLAKAKGIRNFDGFHSIFWHIDKVIGNNNAMAPILFINEDKKAATIIIIIMYWFCERVRREITFPAKLTIPASCKPLLIRSTSATVITAGCPNPKKALSAGTTPNKTSEAKHMSVTAS